MKRLERLSLINVLHHLNHDVSNSIFRRNRNAITRRNISISQRRDEIVRCLTINLKPLFLLPLPHLQNSIENNVGNLSSFFLVAFLLKQQFCSRRTLRLHLSMLMWGRFVRKVKSTLCLSLSYHRNSFIPLPLPPYEKSKTFFYSLHLDTEMPMNMIIDTTTIIITTTYVYVYSYYFINKK